MIFFHKKKKIKLFNLISNFLNENLKTNDVALAYNTPYNSDLLGWKKFNKKVMLNSICKIQGKDEYNGISAKYEFFKIPIYKVQFEKKWKTKNGRYIYNDFKKTDYESGARITFTSDVLKKLLYISNYSKISFFINNNKLRISNK